MTIAKWSMLEKKNKISIVLLSLVSLGVLVFLGFIVNWFMNVLPLQQWIPDRSGSAPLVKSQVYEQPTYGFSMRLPVGGKIREYKPSDSALLGGQVIAYSYPATKNPSIYFALAITDKNNVGGANRAVYETLTRNPVNYLTMVMAREYFLVERHTIAGQSMYVSVGADPLESYRTSTMIIKSYEFVHDNTLFYFFGSARKNTKSVGLLDQAIDSIVFSK